MYVSVCLSVYKDSLKTNLKNCGIAPRELIDAPLNKSAWRSQCHDAVADFEDKCVDALRSKRARRKAGVSMNPGVWVCDVCGRSSLMSILDWIIVCTMHCIAALYRL